MIRLRVAIGDVMRNKRVTAVWLSRHAEIALRTAQALAGGETRTVRFDVMERVAHALGVRPKDLFEEEEE